MPATQDRVAIHTFVPSPTGARVIERGKDGRDASWPACAECGHGRRIGHFRASPSSSRARVTVPASTIPPVGAGISHEPTNVERVPPWQLKALELHVAEALRVDVSYALRILLLDTQRAIRSELSPTTVRHAPDVELPATRPATVTPPRHDQPLSAGTSTIGRGIRNDRFRALYARAVSEGWAPKPTGSGHVRLTGPSGSSFVISITSDGGGRAFRNTRAQAKRAGLDVTGL